MPGSAHAVSRGQPGSERRALQVSGHPHRGSLAEHEVLLRDRAAALHAGPDQVGSRGDLERERAAGHASTCTQGVVTVERSRTSVMSRPAIGCGTDGVIAMSSAAHGPEGITTGVGSAVVASSFRARRACAGVGPAVGPAVGVGRSGRRGGGRGRRGRGVGHRAPPGPARTTRRWSRRAAARCPRRAAWRCRAPSAGGPSRRGRGAVRASFRSCRPR